METTKFNTGVNSLSALNVPGYYTKNAERLGAFAAQMVERYADSVQGLMERGIYDGVVMDHHRAKLQQYKAIAAAPALYVSETETPTTPETENAPAYEETHAARCLSIYLNNTADIYNRYTVPAIELAKVCRPDFAEGADLWNNTNAIISRALQAAARLVRKHDHMTPTAADVEHVKRDYIAYIIECAQYETANA